MRTRGLKKLVRRERPKELTPLYDIERWFEDAWKKPFSLLGPTFWQEFGGEPFEFSPHVDIFEQDNHYVMRAELPGIKKDDIKIDLSENIMTISGEKKQKENIEKEDYYRYECSFGSFVRRFELPDSLDVNKIDAHFEDGVLEVKIPIIESVKEHKKIVVH